VISPLPNKKNMKINIQSIHFDADEKLLDYVNKRLEKLSTYYDGIISTDVYLRLDNDSGNDNKNVEVKLAISGNPIFASEQSAKFETATDLVLDKLTAQVRKHKEKIQAKG